MTSPSDYAVKYAAKERALQRYYYEPVTCDPRKNNDLFWMRRRCDVADPRFDKPVARYKPCMVEPRQFVEGQVQDSTTKAVKSKKPMVYFATQRDKRTNEWSTLRQMLEHRGNPERTTPPRYGTGPARPPIMGTKAQTRFPQIRSEITV